MPTTIRWEERGAAFNVSIYGYGFGFQIGGCSAMHNCFIILSWHIMKRYQLWRSETHSRMNGIYHYRCIKDGRVVEDLTLRSPIVNNA